MEDDDASKFVTHLKGTENKKTISNKDDSSALIDDGLSESYDNDSPFGLPDVDPLIANTDLSNSGINKIQANDDDEVISLCPKIHNNTSLFQDSDESVGLMDMSVQHPPKRQVKIKRAKKERAVTLVKCYTMPPEERREPEHHYCFADTWGKYMRKVTLPLKYGPPPPVNGNDQRR